ncbi:DUF3306 domain-containing protein [Vibrio kyushuensis]|uniref:DUF3306 domain-containing protein n=1 Tax=Vibrio kyushuensis TaxID=2910249 RepID=UPI003D0A3B9E
MATNFISRWSKRKLSEEEQESPLNSDGVSTQPTSLATEHAVDEADNVCVQSTELDVIEEPTDNIEPLEAAALSESEPSISAMLLSDVDPLIKKAALRKLFMSEEFNQVDALNDYDHDYSSVKSLTSEVAQSLREWVNDSEAPCSSESSEVGEPAIEEELRSTHSEQLDGNESIEPEELEQTSELDLSSTQNVTNAEPNLESHSASKDANTTDSNPT